VTSGAGKFLRPGQGWLRIVTHSSAVSSPGLNKIESWYSDFAYVVEIPSAIESHQARSFQFQGDTHAQLLNASLSQ